MQNLKDHWAYLDRYRAENRVLQAQPDKNRVVFIGDSIIAGWSNYPLFTENKHFINRGINGQTTSQILRRFKADVISLQPKAVLILVGTNDIAENNGPISLAEIQKNFQTMLALATANEITAIFGSLLPVSEYYWNKKISEPNYKIKLLNQFLQDLTNDCNALFVDFYSLLEQDNAMNKIYSSDGVHPNYEGYSEMTNLFKKQQIVNF